MEIKKNIRVVDYYKLCNFLTKYKKRVEKLYDKEDSSCRDMYKYIGMLSAEHEFWQYVNDNTWVLTQKENV